MIDYKKAKQAEKMLMESGVPFMLTYDDTDMGIPEYVDAESPEEAKAKAEANVPEEFKAVYYVDYVKEVQK